MLLSRFWGKDRDRRLEHRLSGSPLALGRTAEVYVWQDHQVLKLFYAWVPGHVAQHEIEIGRVVATMPLPTPKLIDALESRQAGDPL